eukprot:TRINITY_DN16041_c0_g1_i1.p1 TRINITY_DN16041_c0_g1~~TRINITY_DN16041_c0_g1_i1.p1  ORF type:complete len:737 (+),score=116.67 TRINITY_DN16041_c0_g1_i1:52-2262(+)
MDKKVIRLMIGAAMTVSCLGYNQQDWLIDEINTPATVSVDGDQITMSNGIVSRTFVTSPAFGTIDVVLNAPLNFGGEQSVFRAVTNETMLSLNGTQYLVGGLRQASTFRAYCNRTELSLLPPNSEKYFKYSNHSTSLPVAPFPWTPGTRHSPKGVSWPPKGVVLTVNFMPSSASMPQVLVSLHFQMLTGVPLIQKWMSVKLLSGQSVVVTAATVDQLSVMPRFGAYFSHGAQTPTSTNNGAASTAVPLPLLQSLTDQAHVAQCRWVDDFYNSADPLPGCETCRDMGSSEPLLTCNYTMGPGAVITAASTKNVFESYKVMHLISDSTDLDRHSLSRHRVTEALAPHVMENPIFFHGTSNDDVGFKKAIDQMAEVGFEMFIYSFGSGFDLESQDPAYLNKIKAQIQYAHSKGIEVGGYDLICLQRGSTVPKKYQAVGHEENACFASGWYDDLNAMVLNFVNETGLSMLETDGPYGGGSCSSTEHEHHFGLDDSVYQQTQYQNEFYKEMRKLNVFVNQPDNYYFQGGSKSTLGYSEKQYSLPRWRDLSVSRMGLYDDLYLHLPTQGWMFLPIIDYEGGGPDASFSGHDKAYEWAVAQYLGAGVAACYRGSSPYNNTSMKAKLQKWISFYKRHRETLTKAVVHVRRPDMQSWDGWLHVNPFSGSSEVGLFMVFNPTQQSIDTHVALDIYYTGAGSSSSVKVTANDDPSTTAMFATSNARVVLPLKLAPESINYFVIEKAQ